MATYNFTVRATDNLGAYADRQFSITVNNTNIERFVAVGTTGLAHSPDGTNWTLESGQGGYGVTFGNGQWVVYGGVIGGVTGLGALQIRTSTDAYNWTTRASGIPASTSIGGFTAPSYEISCLRFINGVWTAFVTTTNWSNGGVALYSLVEYTSPDLVNWTYKNEVYRVTSGSGTANASNYIYAHDFQYDANLGMSVVSFGIGFGTVGVCSRSNGGGWGTRVSVSYSVTIYSGALSFCNGLWAYAAPSINGGALVYTSTDGVGWTQRIAIAGTGNIISGLAYSNGRLLSRIFRNDGNGQSYQYSLNGGRTWTSGASVQNWVAVPVNSPYIHQPIASYAGKTLVVQGDGSQTVYLSTNDFTSATAISLPGVGTTLGLGVRNT